jgi:hypothetical protein
MLTESFSRVSLPERYQYPSPGFACYWKEKTGQQLLNQLGYIPDEASIEAYAALYMECDIAADRIVREIFEQHGHKKAHQWLNEAIDKGSIQVPDLPDLMRELFQEMETVPDWLNYDRMEKGAALCRRAGNFSAIVLRNYSLMGGYESSAINKPLVMTGALKKGAAKRMAETYDFWVNITGKDAMRLHQIGYKSAIKARFVHSLVRCYLLKSPDWKNEKWGLPLNQGDMVATHLGFTLVYLVGLRKVGFKPSDAEIDGLFHLWKYIGFLLGIPVDYLPETENQAIEMLYKWTMAQPVADEDTRALAISLVEEPLSANFPEKEWQKKAQVQIHLAFNELLMSRESCDRVGIPESTMKYVPALMISVNSIFEKLVNSNQKMYQWAVRRGRGQQEFLRRMFQKAHPSVWK